MNIYRRFVGILGSTSVPVTIPSGGIQRGSIGSLSPTLSSPMAAGFGTALLGQANFPNRNEQPSEQVFVNIILSKCLKFKT